MCFATDEDDTEASWVQPCMCKGTTKWVHQYCLQRWIDEKQKGNSTAKVACPQCNMEYIIIFPKVGPIVYILEKCDKIINMVCPVVAGSAIVGSLWWTAVTYGAITVMQVLGSEQGVHIMQVADPLFLLISLPTIPIMLILCNMVRWEDYVLRLWRKHSLKIPFSTSDAVRSSRIPADTTPLSDPISILRVMCGALVFPTISTIAGKVMFGSVKSNFQRTLLGAIGFKVIKGMLKLYYKQQQYLCQANRVILDYKPPEQPILSPPDQPVS